MFVCALSTRLALCRSLAASTAKDYGNPVYYRWVPRHSTAFGPVNWVLMRRLFRQCSAENSPHLEESTEPGGRLGQFSHNGIVPVVETVLQLVQVRSDRRLLFSQSLLSFLGLLFRAALRPGNRDCTGEVPVPDTGRTAGGALCPPTPRKRPTPPLKNLFSVLVQGRRTELGCWAAFSWIEPGPGANVTRCGIGTAPFLGVFFPKKTLAVQPIESTDPVGLLFPFNQIQDFTGFFRLRVVPSPVLKIDFQ